MADALILANGNKAKLLEYYLDFKNKTISESTPVKKSLRTGGNTASCFSIMAYDNIESIIKAIESSMLISKSGGGLAVYLGKIRPESSTIQHVEKAATHINKWVKFFDLVAYTVDQLGSRKGAITVSLDWFHLDFMEFMQVSSEDGGDIRKKAFDILPQFLLNKYLLRKVKAREDVYLVNNHDCIKHLNIDLTELIEDDFTKAYEVVLQNLDKIAHKKVNAYKMWVEMWDAYFKVGKINITNKDGINIGNYLKKHYKAQTANLCIESFSINTKKYDHTCNLMSINLAEVVKDETSLRRVVRNTVDALNRIIDVSTFPTKRTKASARDLRNTGIGLVGGADWLAYKNMTYNVAGIAEIERVQELITYYAYERSIELAIEHGSYKLFKKADYSKMFGKTPKQLNEMSLNGLDWVKLNKRIVKYGIRNFLLISPAPNAGTAIVLGASPNFAPVTSLCHFKDMQKMTPIIVPPYADTKFPYYRTRGSFDGVFFLELSAAIQRWTDTGVSNEIGINPDIFSMAAFSEKVIELMLNDELKGVYYMSETSCVSCAN
jgi:ribonucleoside-diphosphate reductase alpha chain